MIEHHWYRRTNTVLTFLLIPFSWLFGLLITLRCFFYSMGWKKKINLNIPVIVIGNLTMGGTGKTPLVIWLAEILKEKGYRPGIVSRGVGGKQTKIPKFVTENSNICEVGDEADLLVKRTQCPLVICVDRVAAVQTLLQKTHCNIVISDDGLQHYRLGRHIEMVVIDSDREFGNGQLLPAGPLREPIKKLKKVDFIIVNGKKELTHAAFKAKSLSQKIEYMTLEGKECFSIMNPDNKIAIDQFKSKTIHALAAIGNPKRFFETLRDFKLNIIEHIYPDHYLYQRKDIYFTDDLHVIMTEKDAVKCINFSDKRHWYLPISVKLSVEFENKFFYLLNEKERICDFLKK